MTSSDRANFSSSIFSFNLEIANSTSSDEGLSLSNTDWAATWAFFASSFAAVYALTELGVFPLVGSGVSSIKSVIVCLEVVKPDLSVLRAAFSINTSVTSFL